MKNFVLIFGVAALLSSCASSGFVAEDDVYSIGYNSGLTTGNNSDASYNSYVYAQESSKTKSAYYNQGDFVDTTSHNSSYPAVTSGGNTNITNNYYYGNGYNNNGYGNNHYNNYYNNGWYGYNSWNTPFILFGFGNYYHPWHSWYSPYGGYYGYQPYGYGNYYGFNNYYGYHPYGYGNYYGFNNYYGYNPYGYGMSPYGYGYNPYGYGGGYGGNYGPFYSPTNHMKTYTLTSSGYYKNGNQFIGHHQYSNATPQQYASYSIDHSKMLVIDPTSSKPISVPKASNRKTFTLNETPQGRRGVKEAKLASSSKPWQPTVVSNPGIGTGNSVVGKQTASSKLNRAHLGDNHSSTLNRNNANVVKTVSSSRPIINRTASPSSAQNSSLRQWRTSEPVRSTPTNVRNSSNSPTPTYRPVTRTGRQPARVSSPTNSYSSPRTNSNFSSSPQRNSQPTMSTPSRGGARSTIGSSSGSGRSTMSRPSSSGVRRGF